LSVGVIEKVANETTSQAWHRSKARRIDRPLIVIFRTVGLSLLIGLAGIGGLVG